MLREKYYVILVYSIDSLSCVHNGRNNVDISTNHTDKGPIFSRPKVWYLSFIISITLNINGKQADGRKKDINSACG